MYNVAVGQDEVKKKESINATTDDQSLDFPPHLVLFWSPIIHSYTNLTKPGLQY